MLVKNPVNHQRYKYHCIRSQIDTGNITVSCVPIGENISDIFTNAVNRMKLNKFRSSLLGH